MRSVLKRRLSNTTGSQIARYEVQFRRTITRALQLPTTREVAAMHANYWRGMRRILAGLDKQP